MAQRRKIKTTWSKLYKVARYNDPQNRPAIERSRENNANPKTRKHGRQSRSR